MASYILERSHEAIAAKVQPGDTVVDATLGNGWDTVFLARLVGRAGQVIGFDVQAVAIEATRLRLEAADLLGRCTLVQGSHERPFGVESLSGIAPTAIMFNLGYLPGGDKTITTVSEVTIRSLETMSELLAAGGVMTVVCYRGHRGAEEEYQAVRAWASGLQRPPFETKWIVDAKGPEHAPVLLVVRKCAGE